MTSQFNLTKTDNLDDYSVVQGATLKVIIRFIGSDISNWEFKGQIRKNWLDNEEDILADFDFATIPPQSTTETIDSTPTTVTYITGLIDEAITANIPLIRRIRASAQETAIPGKNVWVYDIFGKNPSPEDVLRLKWGWVEIAPRVTEDFV